MFNKGESGNPAGRPKGSKNKLKRLVAELEAIGFNPAAELINQYRLLPDGEAKLRVLNDLMKYIYPTPKEEKIAAESPEESVERVQDLQKQLEEMCKPITPTDPTRETKVNIL